MLSGWLWRKKIIEELNSDLSGFFFPGWFVVIGKKIKGVWILPTPHIISLVVEY